jgi:hypothetical protein
VEVGRLVREGDALSGADYGNEEALCSAGDGFEQMISAVALLDVGGRSDDEKLVGGFSERSIADLSTAELLKLLEAKKRLASSSAATGRKIGLFDSVDADMDSDRLSEETEIVKPTDAPPASSLVDLVMEKLNKTLDDRLKPYKLRVLIEPQGGRRADRGECRRDGARKDNKAASVGSDEEESDEET